MDYMRRNEIGIVIHEGNRNIQVKTGIKNYINTLCMNNLSTYEGRRKAVINLIKRRDNIPIFVDDTTFLYPTKSLREYDMMFINYHSVLSFKKIDTKSTLFIFNNLKQIIVRVSINKVREQHKRIEIISEYFKKSN